MKISFYIKPLAGLFCLALLLSGCDNAKKSDLQSAAIPVIFDTDVGNDIDDVVALQMLINYHKEGKIDLLGIGIGKGYPRVVEYIDAYCRLNDLNDMPLGYAVNGSNGWAGKFVQQTLDTLIDGRPVMQPVRKLDANIPEGYKLFRKLLASQQDNSVVFIAVGPVTNLGDLINSGPDEYSELNGVDLIAKKVKVLSIMSGTYNDDTFNNPEWNVWQDLQASKDVYSKWPTDIIASGSEVGVRVLYPHQSILKDFPGGEAHPLCISYKLYETMPYDRPAWDMTSVIYAIDPENSYLDISPRGTILVAEDGKTVFEASENGKHRFLVLKPEKTEQVVQAIVQSAKVLNRNNEVK